MTDILLLFTGILLVNSVVLSRLQGLHPLLEANDTLQSAIGISVLTTLILTLSFSGSYLLHHHLLLPSNLGFLRIICFILVITMVMSLTAIVTRTSAPVLHAILGSFLPLIALNCLVLGTALLESGRASTFAESLLLGCATAVAFSLVQVLFCAMQQRLALVDAPAPFRGPAILLIAVGLISLAFMGLDGLAG